MTGVQTCALPISLYHWDLPETLSQKGGWTNREIVARFGEFAHAIGEHFGDRIKNYFPINEPWVVSWLGYGIGIHAPGHKNLAEAFAAAHHTVMSHYAAFDALKALGLNVGPVQNQSQFIPDDSVMSIKKTQQISWMQSRIVSGWMLITKVPIQKFFIKILQKS